MYAAEYARCVILRPVKRIPEPELMVEHQQARAYAEADFGEPHNHLVAISAERLGCLTGRIVDLGCGPADVTVRFAQNNPDCTIVGIDGSAPMLQWGHRRIAAADLADRVELRLCRLPLSEPLDEHFDAVLSASLLHHLTDPAVLWQTSQQLAVRGAPLFVWDLRRPATTERAAELTQLHASEDPQILQRDFYNSLLAAYQPDEIRTQLKEAGLEGLTVESLGDRHLVVYGRLPR